MTPSTLAVLGSVVVVVLLAISAFFSSSEIAVFSLSEEWFDRQAATGDRRAVVLHELHDDPHRLLVTLLVGNNVVNIAISSIVTVIVAGYVSAGSAIAVTTVITSTLVLLFGEILPKAFGLGNAERWALTVARPVRVVERLLSPIIVVFVGLTGWITPMVSGDTHIERPYTE